MTLLQLSQSSTVDLVACFLPAAAAAFRPAKQVQSAIQQLTDPPLLVSLFPLFLTLILSDLSAEIWGRLSDRAINRAGHTKLQHGTGCGNLCVVTTT